MTTDNPGSAQDSTAQPPDPSSVEKRPELSRKVKLRQTKIDPLRIAAVAAIEVSPFPNEAYGVRWLVDTLRRDPDDQGGGDRSTRELLDETRRVHRILLDAIKDGELTQTPSGKLHLMDVYAWWKANGNPPKSLVSAVSEFQPQNAESERPPVIGATSYMSPDLLLAIRASEVFWGKWKPESRGQRVTADKIQRWLQGEKLEGFPPNPTPVGKETAKRIDSLIRPPEVKAGGNLPT